MDVRRGATCDCGARGGIVRRSSPCEEGASMYGGSIRSGRLRHRTSRRWLLGALAAGSAGLVALACGGDGDSKPKTTAQTAATSTPGSAAAPSGPAAAKLDLNATLRMGITIYPT